MFTRNKVIAAPLIVTKPRIADGLCQAVLINSGNANACTGEAGLQVARSSGAEVAKALSIDETLVAVSSTGVIGVPLPVERLTAAVPSLCQGLAADKVSAVAEAIMTTDSFSKTSCRTIKVNGTTCQVVALAKGAGMIHPNMATHAWFCHDDAAVASE